MRPQATDDAIQDAPREIAPRPFMREAVRGDSSIENWLHHHLDAVAYAVVAAGLVLRLIVAGRSYLNPDEALHYVLFHQPSIWLAYKASLTNAHPPLIYFVLYYWRFLGRSELVLRLPSVIAGTAFCWVLYKWIGIVFGKAASLTGLILAAFSPALIALSAEVRQYALLLFCMSCALYFLARAFEEKSVRQMWCYSIFLYLAILSHYSAAFFTLALGVYCLAKIAESWPGWKFVFTWAGGQAGALAIYGFLYVTHVSKIGKSDMALWASPFDASFFHLGQGSLLTFTQKGTSAIFLFLFEQEYMSQVMLVLFLAGVALLLFFRGLASWKDSPRSWPLGLLLLLPFVTVWGAAIAGIYPYVGSRHTVFLAPFVIAGVSYALAKIYGTKMWALLLIAILLVGGANTSGKTFEPYIKKENQQQSLMVDAMDYIHKTIPRSDPILVDMQSSLPTAYYLCNPSETIEVEAFRKEFNRFSCNGYSVVSTNYHVWKLTYENFSDQFEKMAIAYGLHPGDRVWVFQTGWGANLDTELSWFVLKFRCLTPKSFGENITVIPFVVGPDLLPALPPGSPHLTPLGRCSN